MRPKTRVLALALTVVAAIQATVHQGDPRGPSSAEALGHLLWAGTAGRLLPDPETESPKSPTLSGRRWDPARGHYFPYTRQQEEPCVAS